VGLENRDSCKTVKRDLLEPSSTELEKVRESDNEGPVQTMNSYYDQNGNRITETLRDLSSFINQHISELSEDPSASKSRMSQKI
jgi:hypothetical protein